LHVNENWSHGHVVNSHFSSNEWNKR
jgi:hypothetical protein